MVAQEDRMTGEPLSFFPKYTTLCSKAGGVHYVSEPVEVTGYKSLTAEMAYVAATLTTTVTGTLEESSDLEQWSAVSGGGLAPAVGSVERAVVSGTLRYVRLRVSVSNAGVRVVVVWARAVARVR